MRKKGAKKQNANKVTKTPDPPKPRRSEESLKAEIINKVTASNERNMNIIMNTSRIVHFAGRASATTVGGEEPLNNLITLIRVLKDVADTVHEQVNNSF